MTNLVNCSSLAAILAGSLAFITFGAGAYSVDARKREMWKQLRTI